MRPDIGKEYFEGDIKDMITNITSHVLNITNYDYKDDIVEKYETIEKIVKIKAKSPKKIRILNKLLILKFLNIVNQRKIINANSYPYIYPY